MFDWFRASCPVEPHAKEWIEQRLHWLVEEFGTGSFLDRDPILPDRTYFPDPYDSSDEAVQLLFERVCGYMDVDPDTVQLQFTTEPRNLWLVNDRGDYLPNGAAGMYHGAENGVTLISLETSEFHEPMHLVGTMAHELSHLKLMGENRVEDDIFDNELLTDLTAVFHGFGIFLANSPRAWLGQFSTWPSTSVRRPEYMSSPMYGYALAHAGWLRGARKPTWLRHLAGDSRAAFKQGLQYLWETGDSTFRPASDI